jgi:aromatic-L-amino-acid decarboxylase
MALQFMGRSGYASVVERQIDLTHYLARRIDEMKDYERVADVETAVCCFKFLPAEVRDAKPEVQDQLQQKLQQRIERGGEAWLTTTILHGRRSLRVNINSYLTEQRHVDDLLELLERVGSELMR